MSTMAPSIEAFQPPCFERDGAESPPTHHQLFAPSPTRSAVMGRARESHAHAATSHAGDAEALTTRIRMLIAREGGTSALARRCDCSEGTVRNWRDGHSDLSRARCVMLARALNISLPWLVTGEGPIQPERAERDDEASAESAPPPVPAASSASGIDAQRLAATLKLLQSYICLIGGSLNVERRSELVAELYGLLRDAGEPQEVDRLIAFHSKLGAQLRSGHASLI